ncbi:hypothetical protein I4U23_024859 [Adineta vaga]|nr:hypothetical protein I4U23_024859 [Adineta vaga]
MNTLSIRAQEKSECISEILNKFMLVQKNTYDDEFNVNGICNLGVAENYLCENELVSKLQSIQVWNTTHIYYPNSLGLLSFRQTLCKFFQNIFHLNYQLNPDRMLISSGLSGVMSLLSYIIGNRDDVLLIASPYYTAFDHDVSALANCATFRCPLLEQSTGKFILSVEIFRHGYDQAIKQGLHPCGIILVNPHNPTGDIYDERTIQPILEFAAEKQLHVIIDEIYALSVYENEKPFQSILNYTSIIDPQRTHFVWSLSKDFALSGLRLGVLYAGSDVLCSCAAIINFLQVPSTIVQEIAMVLFSDQLWLDSYIKLNRSRLTRQYEKIKAKVEELDERIVVHNLEQDFFYGVIFIYYYMLIHFKKNDDYFKSSSIMVFTWLQVLFLDVLSQDGFVLYFLFAKNGLMKQLID